MNKQSKIKDIEKKLNFYRNTSWYISEDGNVSLYLLFLGWIGYFVVKNKRAKKIEELEKELEDLKKKSKA